MKRIAVLVLLLLAVPPWEALAQVTAPEAVFPIYLQEDSKLNVVLGIVKDAKWGFRNTVGAPVDSVVSNQDSLNLLYPNSQHWAITVNRVTSGLHSVWKKIKLTRQVWDGGSNTQDTVNVWDDQVYNKQVWRGIDLLLNDSLGVGDNFILWFSNLHPVLLSDSGKVRIFMSRADTVNVYPAP